MDGCQSLNAYQAVNINTNEMNDNKLIVVENIDIIIDEEIIESVDETFCDDGKVVPESQNGVNIDSCPQDYEQKEEATVMSRDSNNDDNNNNNNNNHKNINRRKRIKEELNEMNAFPTKRIKSSSNDSYVFELQLSSLEVGVDFSHLTFIRLSHYLRTEQAAFIFAVKMGLINVDPGECRKCGQRMYLTQLESTKGYHEFRCRRPCRAKLSILENTCFSQSHAELSQILTIIYCWCLGLNHKQAEFQCQLGVGAVIDFYKLCRRVCMKSLIAGSEAQTDKPIGGTGFTVEIGTTHYDKVNKGKTLKSDKKEKKYSDDAKRWIFTGICRETKECFVFEFREQNDKTLISSIKHKIAAGSMIISNLPKNFSSIDNQLDKMGFQRCSSPSTSKLYSAFIEYAYSLKYPTSNPGLKYEMILTHIAKAYPGAFLKPTII